VANQDDGPFLRVESPRVLPPHIRERGERVLHGDDVQTFGSSNGITLSQLDPSAECAVDREITVFSRFS